MGQGAGIRVLAARYRMGAPAACGCACAPVCVVRLRSLARLAQRRAAASNLNAAMFATVLRWEIRTLQRDPACWLALALAIAAIVFALINGGRWISHLETVRAAAQVRDLSARIEARELAGRIDSKAARAPFITRDPRNAYGYANGLMANYA